jgi:multiple sugar transport system substrate-binding protein
MYIPGMARGATRRELLIAGAGACAALVSGCGGGSSPRAAFGTGAGYDGPEVELAFWNGFTGGDGPQMLTLIDRFSKENKNISVRMVTVRWEDFYQKVPAAVRSGVGPHIALMHVDQLATSAAHDAIVPLDDLARDLQLRQDDFAAPVWQAGEYRGRRYGIPLDMHPLGLFMNTKVLEDAGMDPKTPPRTGDDYDAALQELKAKKIQGDWVSPFFFTGGLRFQSLLWQFGGELVNEDATKATWNSDAGVDALNWMISLVKKGYSPSNVGQDADNIAFKNGQAAFIWQGIWGVGDYGVTEGLKWRAAPLPRIGTQDAAWANSHQFVVMRPRSGTEDEMKASKVFIDWVTRNSASWAEAGQIPARRSAREDPVFKKLEAQSALAEQVPNLRFAGGVPGITDVRESTLDQALAEAITGAMNPREALDMSARRASELLRLNREKYATA